MARPKVKNSKKMSFNLEAEIVDRLHEYADEKGQSLTVAVERILKEALDKHDEESAKKA